MQDFYKSPRVVRAARRHLIAGETVLWARVQHGLGRRGWLYLGSALLGYIAGWTAVSLIAGSPGAFVFFAVVQSPFVFWWLVEMFARSFIVTDRRVMFLSRIWPYRWSYWNCSELDARRLESGKGRGIIRLGPFLSDTSNRGWRPAVFPDYIEQVPDIETVRDLILQQISRRPEPVEKPSKVRGPRPRIYGTRSG